MCEKYHKQNQKQKGKTDTAIYHGDLVDEYIPIAFGY